MATPPKLVSLFQNYWDGYEAGNDTNHVLKLGKKRSAFKCTAPQDLMTDSSSAEGKTIVAGIVDTKLLDCSYWSIVPWGILGVQVTDDRIEAEWVKTFSYEKMIAEILSEALTDQSNKRIGFLPGPFFSATNVSPQNSTDFDFDPNQLWNQSAAGIYNGQASTTMTFACDIRETAGKRYNQVETGFSSPVSILISPNHSKEVSSPEIEIAFDASGYFKHEVFEEYISASQLVVIKGVKECGTEGHGSFVDRTVIVKGFLIDNDLDPMSFTPKSMVEYAEKKRENVLPNFEGMQPIDVYKNRIEVLPLHIDDLKRRYLYEQGLGEAVSQEMFDEWIVHPRGKLSAIAAFEQNLFIMQQQHDALQ